MTTAWPYVYHCRSMTVGWLAGKVLWSTDVIHHCCILTVLWDTKHIKLSLIIWVDAGELVRCVFNAKYCFSSACTISFYNLVICDFVLPPNTQKIWNESLTKPFCVVASSHMCHSHGPGGKCRCRERNPMMWPKIRLVGASLRAVTQGRPPSLCEMPLLTAHVDSLCPLTKRWYFSFLLTLSPPLSCHVTHTLAQLQDCCTSVSREKASSSQSAPFLAVISG